VQTLKVQVNNFVTELRNLKEIEAKYKEENDEIQRNINEESRANSEFTAQIKEFELRIRQKEAHL
jgi:predicted RNase H-like nuclease (RuvC/YqgF family)